MLRQTGYSSYQIEKWLGISNDTALRAEKEATPEELSRFELDFKEAVEKKKKEGLGMVLKRIQQIIPKYPRLDHLVKAGEWFEGKTKEDEAPVGNQIKNTIQSMEEVLIREEQSY